MNMLLHNPPIFSPLWSRPYYSTCSSVSLLKLLIAFSVCVHVHTVIRALMCAIVHVLRREGNLCKSAPSFYHVTLRIKLKLSGLEASGVRFQLSPHLPSSVLAYNCMETKEHQYCETLRYRALIACSCVSSSACLHWGHFSELCLQEQPCSWSKKQAHLLTARCKGREASQFSTAGQQRKLTAEWDEAIWTTPYHPTEARARIDQ